MNIFVMRRLAQTAGAQEGKKTLVSENKTTFFLLLKILNVIVQRKKRA